MNRRRCWNRRIVWFLILFAFLFLVLVVHIVRQPIIITATQLTSLKTTKIKVPKQLLNRNTVPWSSQYHHPSFEKLSELLVGTGPVVEYTLPSSDPSINLLKQPRKLIRNLHEYMKTSKPSYYSHVSFNDSLIRSPNDTCSSALVSMFYIGTISVCGSILDNINGGLFYENDYEVFELHDRTDYCGRKFYNIHKLQQDDVPMIANSSSYQVKVIHVPKLFIAIFKWGHGFQHFIKDVIPQLLLGQSLLESNPDIRVLMHYQEPNIRKILEKLRFPLSRILPVRNLPLGKLKSIYEIQPEYIYKADELYFARCLPGPQFTGIYPSQLYSLHSSFFRSNSSSLIKKDTSKKKRKIVLVSRKGGSNKARNITNEQQLLKSLQRNFHSEYEIKKFVGTEMTLEDTMELFNEADFVIGPHGGGFYNIVGCEKETNIIELVPDDYGSKQISYFAQKLGLNYVGLVKNKMKNSEHFGPAPIDWFVHTIKMLKTKDEITKQKLKEIRFPKGWRLSPLISLVSK